MTLCDADDPGISSKLKGFIDRTRTNYNDCAAAYELLAMALGHTKVFRGIPQERIAAIVVDARAEGIGLPRQAVRQATTPTPPG